MDKEFCYMVQSPASVPGFWEEGPSRELLLLTFVRPSDYQDSVYRPLSSWNQGRNALLASALNRPPCRYYIFADDDVALVAAGGGRPLDVFESFLRQTLPAIGVCRFDWQVHDAQHSVTTLRHCDALFNAFHSIVIPFVLPYTQLFDAESWYYSQFLICAFADLLCPRSVVQLNGVKVTSTRHTTYPAARNWEAIRSFARDATMAGRGWTPNDPRSPDAANADGPVPVSSVRIPCLSEVFRLDHPYWQEKWMLQSLWPSQWRCHPV